MKIFITGANGFIGNALVELLVSRNYEVVAMIRPGNLPSFDLFSKNLDLVYADLTDKESLKRVIPMGSVVVNLAANPYDAKKSFEVNVDGTRNLVEVCKINKVRKLIHISSQAVKIKRKGVYAKTKLFSEDEIKEFVSNWTIFRPSLVYGLGEKGLFNKIRILSKKLPVLPVFGDGKTKVFPVLVEDLCNIIEESIRCKHDLGKIVDIGAKTGVSYNKLYQKIVYPRKTKLVYLPVWIGLFLTKIFEILGFNNPPFYADNVLGSTQKTKCLDKERNRLYKTKVSEFGEGLLKLENSKKRVAIVGLGKMGMLHSSVLSSMSGVEIVALVDSNPALFSTLKSFGVKGNFYRSIDKALKKENISDVFVLTPNWTHFSIVSDLIKRNINVFVEKPVVIDEEQGRKLSKLLKQYKVRTAAGYTLLAKNGLEMIKKVIEEKSLGEVEKYEASYRHSEVLSPRKGWMFTKKLSGGGVLMNPGPHLFSVLNRLFGKEKLISGSIKKIYSIEVEDLADMIFHYDKFKGSVYLSWSEPKCPIAKLDLHVVLEKGSVDYDGKKVVFREGKKISTFIENDLYAGNVFDINPEANGGAYYV